MRIYADASALVKLLVSEPESAALARAIPTDAQVVSSALSVVELARAVRVADLDDDVEPETDALLAGCTLVDIDSVVLSMASGLASRTLKSLEAVHLATAICVAPDLVLVYDRQLARAVRQAGLRVEAPGSLD